MAETDLSQTIADNAAKPVSGSGDSGSIQMHPLPDLVQADLHLANKKAATNRNFGMRFAKLVPPGTR